MVTGMTIIYIVETAITAAHSVVINIMEVGSIRYALVSLAILTNCLGSCSSLNFNLPEKGEMPTDPVSQSTPVLSFYV